MSKIKQGYKQTKVGIIPEDWEVVKLSEVFSKSFYGTSDSTNEIGKYPVLRMGNMQNGTLDLKDLVYLDLEEKEFKKYQLKKGDILLNRTNSYELVGKISLFDLDGDYISASYIVAYRPNFKVINSIFINNLLNTTYFQEKTRTIATKGVSQANINPTSFKEVIKIPLPPLKEQEKIAQILTTWDEAITKQTELLKTKELQKKGLMQKLLSGEVRFSGFTDEWEDIRLEEIIKEISLKTTISNQYEVLSVTKNGIYSQQEHFNKQIASEDNTGYKIVKYGNLVFSTMNLWMGSLDIVRNYDIGIVSPAYKVFEINYEKYDIDFIQHYLKSHHMIWLYNMNSEQGASIVRRNLDLNSLLTTKVKIPSFDEQSKIGEVLSLADDEINLLKKELEELKVQKKALMQKLLTGEVRVKV